MAPKLRDKGKNKAPAAPPTQPQPQTRDSYALQPTLVQPLQSIKSVPFNWYDQTVQEALSQSQSPPPLNQTFVQTVKGIHGPHHTSRSVVASSPTSQQVASRPSSSSQQVASRPSSSAQQVASRPSHQVVTSSANPTKYFTKTKCEQLIVLLENQTWSADPFQIPPRVFYPNAHFLQQSSLHTQQFYEFILIDTDSIVLKKRTNPGSPQIAYSTVTISKILTIDQWGAHPCHTRPFSRPFQPSSFNYYDYQQAWYNTFYFQNATYTHSWMFTFSSKFPFIFPNWFSDWWFYFGCIDQIFPSNVHEAGLMYQNQLQPLRAVAKFPRILLFVAQFSIPWICFWQYTLLSQNSFPYLGRSFQVKWWGNWPQNNTFSTKEVSKYFSNNPTLCSAPDSHFLLARSQNNSKLAATKSKKELRQQLLETLSSLSDSDDSVEDEASQTQDSPISSTDLADDNGDDCCGVLPPIQTRSKSRQSTSR